MMKLSTLAHTIRRRRRQLGVDQKKLSELSGVSVHTISDIESGKANPTVSTLRDLLEVLGLELAIQPRKPAALQTPDSHSGGGD